MRRLLLIGWISTFRPKLERWYRSRSLAPRPKRYWLSNQAQKTDTFIELICKQRSAALASGANLPSAVVAGSSRTTNRQKALPKFGSTLSTSLSYGFELPYFQVGIETWSFFSRVQKSAAGKGVSWKCVIKVIFSAWTDNRFRWIKLNQMEEYWYDLTSGKSVKTVNCEWGKKRHKIFCSKYLIFSI